MYGLQGTVATTLEGQLARLMRVVERMDACGASLGHPGDSTGESIWRGPAHSAWVGSLDQVRRDLIESRTLLQAAVTSTRRALATLGDRG